MSQRPILKKRANKLRKALRASPPHFIDLVEYLKDRGHAQTTGEAERIILAGRVRAGSHKLGIVKDKRPKHHARLKVAIGLPLEDSDYEMADVVQRRVPAQMRGDIIVLGE